ncbi:MAG: response regulator [Bacteroidota bacterium]
MKYEVIIVDDDEVVVFIQEKMVTASGFCDKPLCFLKAKDALEYLSANNDEGTVYVVLLDINMPEMSGWEFLDAIAHYPVAKQMAVAVVTSSVNESDRRKSFNYPGVIAYIEKPLSIDKIHMLKSAKKLIPFFT